MNIRDLQKEAHAIAKEKGWWDATESPPKATSLGSNAPSYSTDAHRSPQSGRTFGDLIALVHSELSEALEAYRDEVLPSKPHLLSTKVASELADVVIRVADMAQYYVVDLASEIETLRRENDERDMTGRTFGDWISGLHESLSFSYASREWDGYAANGFPSWEELLADCVAGVQRMAAHYGIDLDAAIEAKMEYNRTRPYRHGGKAL